MTQAEKGDAENGKEKGGEKEKEQRGVKRPIVPALVPESLQEVRRGTGAGLGESLPAGRGRGSRRRREASGPPRCGGWFPGSSLPGPPPNPDRAFAYLASCRGVSVTAGRVSTGQGQLAGQAFSFVKETSGSGVPFKHNARKKGRRLSE